ncbi:O-methyltransferase [Colletotrichum graminicola]|uniref:O-methyltransferase n=1 Tax=Colletotrichum graminicola (strain M1.001 / M2 / FGSC 10212) TaxID=645133 RepID=E3R0I8_COLGM|nr:O-methyltransferase [Colletotrichum graminicola M1.001]EFQ36626.1 O-methyltransferase [Colletotrichum graminicola M1.001]WDK12975.1 O-methyltransferase [Colletotrichum graminicola]
MASTTPHQCQSSSSRVDLETLGAECLALAKKLKHHLASNGHPQPSFEVTGPIEYPSLDPETEVTRQQLREAAKTLLELASEPDDVLTEDLFNKVHDLNAFAYVSRFQIAQHVPVHGAISYPDLASKTGTGLGQLKRALRHLMTLHVFVEPQPGRVAHTASSRRLVDSRGVRLYNEFVSRDTLRLAAFQLDAIDRWGHDCVEPDKAAHNIAFATEKPLFAYFAENPAKMSEFGDLMAFMATSRFQSGEHLINAFPWASLGPAKMVDMGGNVGHCSAQVAAVADQRMTFVVQDLPEVVARARGRDNDAVPVALIESGRLAFMEHDLFAPQPVTDADIYLLRMILHDWSDDKCVEILRHIAAALEGRPAARLLVMDTVLPPSREWPSVVERPMRSMDLQMALMTNAKERDLGEFEALFRRADARFSICNVVKPVGSLMSLLEVALSQKGGAVR